MTKAVSVYISELHRKFQRFERFTHVNTSEIQEFIYNILYPVEHIVWIEDGAEIRLCICPKDIRRKISFLLFTKGNVILTSATIYKDYSPEQSSEGEKRWEYCYLQRISDRGFSDVTEEITVDVFTAAVGFEILHDTIDEAEQFAKDVIDSEEKESLRMIQEFTH